MQQFTQQLTTLINIFTMNSIRQKTSRAFYLLAIFIVLLSLFAFFNLLYLQQQVKEGVVISNFKDDILEMRRHEKNLFLYHNKIKF